MTTDKKTYAITDEMGIKLDTYIKTYKSEKSPESASKIIQMLDPLILKYLRIISNHNINLKDNLTRTIIFCLVKANGKKASFDTEINRMHALKSFWGFTDNLLSKYDSSDIYNETIIVILDMIERYEFQESTFLFYLNKHLPYRFVDRISELTSDMITNYTVKRIENEALIESLHEEDAELLEKQDGLEDYASDTLGSQWISGAHCHPIFKDLTCLERKIVLLKYGEEDQPTDQRIAETLGYNTRWLSQKRQEILLRLEQQAANYPKSFS